MFCNSDSIVRSSSQEVATHLRLPMLLLAALFISCAAGPVTQQNHIADLREALRDNPDDTRALRELAHRLMYIEEFDQAQIHYEQLVALERRDLDAWFNLGLIHLHTGESEKAGRAFRQVVRWKPDDAEGHTNAGVALARNGEERLALFYFRRAFAESDSVDARYNLAIQLAASENVQAAQRILLDLPATRQPDGQMLVLLGVLALRAGNETEALRYFSRACSEGSNDGCRRADSMREAR